MSAKEIAKKLSQATTEAERKELISALLGLDLRKTNLREVNLSKANLSKADLRWADLSRADLRRADLSNSDLRGASLDGANLDRAKLDGALFDYSVGMSDTNRRPAKVRGEDRFLIGRWEGDLGSTMERIIAEKEPQAAVAYLGSLAALVAVEDMDAALLIWQRMGDLLEEVKDLP